MPNVPPLDKSRLVTGPGVTPALWGALAVPFTTPPHPGVLFLGGASGWHAEFAEMACSLAEAGFTTLALDYVSRNGVNPAPHDRLARWPYWLEMIHAAVRFLQTSPSVAGSPVGLVGLALGASLAIASAVRMPQVRAVVDFYGGIGSGMQSIDKEACELPPLLILHGEADSIVPVSHAQRLRHCVLEHGGRVEMHIYPGVEHGFNARSSPFYSEEPATDSMKRMIAFLTCHLES